MNQRNLLLFYFFFFSFSLPIIHAQEFSYEIDVLDLNTIPHGGKDIVEVALAEEKVFLNTPTYFDDGNLFVFDGQNVESVYTYANSLRIHGTFNQGILLGQAQFGRELHFMDGETYEITLLHSGEVRFVSIMENQAFFTTLNKELFVTDGTPQGTKMLKSNLEFVHNEELQFTYKELQIFIADDQLWRSDGTFEGTYVLSPISTSSTNEPLTISQNLLYYEVSNFGNGTPDLWVSDGTLEGTKKIAGEGTLNLPTEITTFSPTANGLLFVAKDDTHGKELWITDGTEEGTGLLKELISGTESGIKLGVFDEYLPYAEGHLFLKLEEQLWRSDGTNEGSFPLLDFSETPNLNYGWDITSIFTNSKGKIFFMTDHKTGFVTLWNYFDTDSPPVEIRDFSIPFEVREQYSSGEKVFFDTGRELWATDGTLEGTQLLSEDRFFDFLYTKNDLLFFETPSDESNTYRVEPFVSDGTTIGTKLLKDINPGSKSSDPNKFFFFEEKIYFYAEDHTIGKSIYTTDGSTEGTLPVTDLYPFTLSSDLEDLVKIADKMYFTVKDTLWASNGTQEGSYNLGLRIPQFFPLGALENKVFVRNDDGELWVTDGTVAGTQVLLTGNQFDINLFMKTTVFNDKLWFFVNDNINGLELWKTDGTPANTEMAFESAPGKESMFDDPFIGIASNSQTLFFFNGFFNQNRGIWRSDGTMEGTKLIANPSDSNGSFSQLTNNAIFEIQEKFLFSVGKSTWVTDGTSAGTIKLLDEELDNASHLIFNNQLIFSTPKKLWKTDGTIAGTTMLKEKTTPGIFFIRSLKTIGDKFIFTGNNDDNEFLVYWSSDGTIEGTNPINLEESIGFVENNFVPIGENIFFINEENEICYTNNSFTESEKLEVLGNNFESVRGVVNYKNTLFLNASNNIYGQELFFINFDGQDVSTSTIEPEKLSIQYFPNPVKDLLQLKFPEGEISKVTLVDNTGRLMESWQTKGGEMTINLSKFEAGYYFLLANDSKSNLQKAIKLIKL